MAGENEQAASEHTDQASGAGAAGTEIDFGKLSLEDARAVAARFYHEKAKANFEAEKQRAKNKADAEALKAAQADAAELKKIRDSQKTAEQKAIEENAALKSQLAEKDTTILKQTRLNAALKMGATDPEFIAWKLETSGLDPADEATVTKLKAEHPAIFGGPQAGNGAGKRPAAGAGGPVAADKKALLTKEIETMEKTITDAQKLGRTREVFGLLQQRNAKLAELEAM